MFWYMAAAAEAGQITAYQYSGLIAEPPLEKVKYECFATIAPAVDKAGILRIPRKVEESSRFAYKGEVY